VDESKGKQEIQKKKAKKIFLKNQNAGSGGNKKSLRRGLPGGREKSLADLRKEKKLVKK